MRSYLKFFSVFFIFTYFCSIQTGIANITSTQDNINICKYKKTDKDLSCLSLCILEQIDNLNFTDEVKCNFSLGNFSNIKKSLFCAKIALIEPKFNSPPTPYIT